MNNTALTQSVLTRSIALVAATLIVSSANAVGLPGSSDPTEDYASAGSFATVSSRLGSSRFPLTIIGFIVFRLFLYKGG